MLQYTVFNSFFLSKARDVKLLAYQEYILSICRAYGKGTKEMYAERKMNGLIVDEIQEKARDQD